MCGRYTMHHTPGQLEMRFGITQARATPTERYNIAPVQAVPVVLENDGARFLESFQWGLVPSWAKDPGIGNKMINARAETLLEKPSYRQAVSRRRCLLPADGFYEWKTEGSARQPMHIRRKDGELFAFAGLWEEWRQPDDTLLRTCTIITTSPNAVLLPIHDRMPAILLPDQEEIWLDAASHSATEALTLLQPYPADWMEAYPVDRRVNVPTIEDPALLNSL
jgi:putative SOS response-associated peptidase YedK